jgi:hypothetical protein
VSTHAILRYHNVILRYDNVIPSRQYVILSLSKDAPKPESRIDVCGRGSPFDKLRVTLRRAHRWRG